MNTTEIEKEVSECRKKLESLERRLSKEDKSVLVSPGLWEGYFVYGCERKPDDGRIFLVTRHCLLVFDHRMVVQASGRMTSPLRTHEKFFVDGADYIITGYSCGKLNYSTPV